MLAIRLSAEIEARQDKLAKRTGRTKTYYARQAILEHLADLEDVYLAEKRLGELRSGRKRRVPLSRLTKRYGLDD
jgi:RHH-type rel operon transcriptional repressor/antitoxin RelB